MITTITMETLSFEQLHAQMNNLNLQLLQGSFYAGEIVLLDQEVVLTVALLLQVAAVIRKESPSGILVNFYDFPTENGIQVPHLPVPWKRT
jgi:hypothetical protein